MNSNFKDAIKLIEEKALNNFEKGKAFEKLCKVFFENDDVQKQEFSKIWHYEDWAKKNPNFSKIDIGIDLIGELKDNSGLSAIQCKFFNSDYQITKEDLDSFVSASNNKIFKRLILIDTSSADLSINAKSMLSNLSKTYQRIQKFELEQSRINWLSYIQDNTIVLNNKKTPMDHQFKAIDAAEKYYIKNNRGKMIMACGTGKTFTSLKIAEKIADKKFVLYMVPSLALMSQSIKDWKNDCEKEFVAFSACSDKKVGKKKNSDKIEINLSDLAFPATTDPKELSEKIKNSKNDTMIVLFSTYQSIDVIEESQKKYGLSEFDLIICDEAHRTTGATFEDEEESYFVKIHNDKFVKGKKRLYMTATPKIYGNKAKQKADEGIVTLASMDDKKVYGEEFFNRGFNWAVENNLLSDYKVVILAVDEQLVSANLQRSFEEGSELKLNDATKIIGVFKALAKVGFEKKKDSEKNLKPIKKALAFSESIEVSKIFSREFSNVINEYIESEKIKDENKVDLNVEIQHIDGSFNADLRNHSLNWLKESTDKNYCRILSNVKCLSEGVDVPSLDSIIFLHPKKSQIEVVQSVGRVMRKAEGKDIGYVIIPVTVAPGVSPEKALNDNERYKVVWQIVNALRTHDEKLDNKINMMSLGEDVSDKIQVIGISEETEAVTAKIEDVKPRSKTKKKDDNEIINLNESNKEDDQSEEEKQMSFEIEDLSQAIKAKIVQKCGTRDYWENWANDISEIAQNHIKIITKKVFNSNSKEKKIFDKFLNEIRDDLNPEINENDTVEILAQHVITKPVFETLFQGNEFTKENPVSKALEDTLIKLYPEANDIKSESLIKFYNSVKRRAADIISSKGRTKLINELYERFFKNAFPLTTRKLGIVYTPIEAVDFINNSVNYLMKSEFKKTLSDKNVHILDPFTGTGTFITRLIESGIINKKDLPYKFKNELHANEIVLLAYYIAGINIETVYQEIVKENQYQNFKGLVLTDTFQLYEQERDMIADLLPDNSQKRTKQKKLKITAILGNPPYSVGQKSENDDAKNVTYNNLDEKIRKTYLQNSSATLSRNLFDSYIRSIRWASDRIEENGILAFITGNGFLDSAFADGMRKSLTNEFSQIYIIDLKGNIRKSMLNKGDKTEGENIFGTGSMTGISINIFIKKNNSSINTIKYYNLGDNLSKKQKLQKIVHINSIENLLKNNEFKDLKIDKYGDWLKHRLPEFEKFIKIGDRQDKKTVFNVYSQAVLTSRDAWCINFSKKKLSSNIKNLINFYNQELEIFQKKYANKDKKTQDKIFNSLSKDSKKISWSRSLKKQLLNNNKIKFDSSKIIECNYRPFTKSYLYFCKNLNEETYHMPKIFNHNIEKNKIIMVKNRWSSGQIAFMTDKLPLYSPDGGEQCFPLFYENQNSKLGGLFEDDSDSNELNISHGVSDFIFSKFKEKYSNKKISKDDIFYYIYALLHSQDYLKKYEINLSKDLPNIPILKKHEDFKLYSNSGRQLAKLHTNYDEEEKYPLEIIISKKEKYDNLKLFRVEKMKYYSKNQKKDLSTIIYNKFITLKNIPLEAYDYIIYGKPAIDWVIDRQSNRIDQKSGIYNDANDFSNEYFKNPKNSIELLQKVINVSLKTIKIIKDLPKLNI